MQLARDVLRAESPEEALEAWRTARVLGEARDMLASAIAGDDDELRQQLAPLTPLEELDHGRR